MDNFLIGMIEMVLVAAGLFFRNAYRSNGRLEQCSQKSRGILRARGARDFRVTALHAGATIAPAATAPTHWPLLQASWFAPRLQSPVEPPLWLCKKQRTPRRRQKRRSWLRR